MPNAEDITRLSKKANVLIDNCLAWLSILFQAILKHPLGLILIFIAALLFSASGIGYSNGREAFSEFKLAVDRHEKEMELATTTDGTILSNVYLVGTTSRAAIFLQEVKDAESKNFSRPPKYFQVWKRVALLLPKLPPTPINPPEDEELNHTTQDSEVQPLYKQVWKQFLEFFSNLKTTLINRTENEKQKHPTQDDKDSSDTNEKNYHVLVMDRAQIICHAEGKRCENLLKEKEQRQKDN